MTQERATQLGSAHEVQRFHRDVDETKDWIQEKDEALNNDDLGKDLRSVQALQRKHEGLERDLAALGDKVKQTDIHSSLVIANFMIFNISIIIFPLMIFQFKNKDHHVMYHDFISFSFVHFNFSHLLCNKKH